MPAMSRVTNGRFGRRSLVRRLTIQFALIVMLTTAALLAAGGWLLSKEGRNALEVLQRLEAEELAGVLGTSELLSAEEIRERLGNHADSDYALYFIQIENDRGEVVFRSANLGDAFVPSPEAHEKSWIVQIAGAESVGMIEKRSGPWRIWVGIPVGPMRHVFDEYAQVGLLLLVAATLVSILTGYVFSRVTVAPLREIERSARRIRADNLSERIVVRKGHAELVALAELLNQTFDRIEAAFAQVRRFTTDASHELKTPLALVRLGAEKLRTRLAGDPEADALAADLLEEADHMKRIIDSLLFIAKVEGGAIAIERKRREMHPFIEDFAEDARALAEDGGLRFELIRNDRGTPLVDAHGLRQLLLNLASNAITATPPGGLITLSSERTETGWRLTVCDEGGGLPLEMLERVFERFTRHQPSASATGSGLGLAICRSIAELHGGAIRAENRTDRAGLRVIFEW